MEISWIKYSETVDIFEVRNFLFERKCVKGTTIYEIWKNSEELIFRMPDYTDFIGIAQAIMDRKVA